MNRRALFLTLVALVALVSLLPASCGGDDDTSSTTGQTAEDDVYVGTIGAVAAEDGMQVRSVEHGTPIDIAGLEAGDVIVAVDDTSIETLDDLVSALDGLAETYDGGDQFELTVVRGKSEKTLSVTLTANVYLGIELVDAAQGGGVLVKAAPRGTPAGDAGIEAGDVIVAVDGQAVGDSDELLQALAAHVAGEKVEIEVTRGSQERTLTATLEKRGQGQLKARPG